MNYEEAKKKVQQYGQEHVMRYYEELDKADQEELLKQIEETDMSVLSLCTHKEDLPEKGVITPLAAMQLDEIEAEKETYRNAGTKAIRDGKVGAVLLAGGMGTRLGSDDPKGMYNIGITKNVYIFERLIGNLMDVVNQTGSYIHLFAISCLKNTT